MLFNRERHRQRYFLIIVTRFPFYHLGVETGGGGDTVIVDGTGVLPGEGSLENIGSNPSELKRQEGQGNVKADKWDTGDVANENLISGGLLGKL